jgi:hypothetical protein
VIGRLTAAHEEKREKLLAAMRKLDADVLRAQVAVLTEEQRMKVLDLVAGPTPKVKAAGKADAKPKGKDRQSPDGRRRPVRGGGPVATARRRPGACHRRGRRAGRSGSVPSAGLSRPAPTARSIARPQQAGHGRPVHRRRSSGVNSTRRSQAGHWNWRRAVGRAGTGNPLGFTGGVTPGYWANRNRGRKNVTRTSESAELARGPAVAVADSASDGRAMTRPDRRPRRLA